jgi:hypothetical protein
VAYCEEAAKSGRPTLPAAARAAALVVAVVVFGDKRLQLDSGGRRLILHLRLLVFLLLHYILLLADGGVLAGLEIPRNAVTRRASCSHARKERQKSSCW